VTDYDFTVFTHKLENISLTHKDLERVAGGLRQAATVESPLEEDAGITPASAAEETSPSFGQDQGLQVEPTEPALMGPPTRPATLLSPIDPATSFTSATEVPSLSSDTYSFSQTLPIPGTPSTELHGHPSAPSFGGNTIMAGPSNAPATFFSYPADPFAATEESFAGTNEPNNPAILELPPDPDFVGFYSEYYQSPPDFPGSADNGHNTGP
jgi:hypothetical protein